MSSSTVVRPDSSRCWPVVACASWYVFLAMLLPKAESVLYIGFMDMLGVSRAEACWPLTLSLIVSQVAGPVYGVLCICLSERTLLAAAALLCSFSLMACALAYSLSVVIVLFGVLFGLGVACAEVLPFSIVSRHYDRYRGTAISSLFVLCALAGFVAPLLAEALQREFGFRMSLFVQGCILFSMLLGCLVVNRLTGPGTNPPEEESALLGQHQHPSSSSYSDSYRVSSMEKTSLERSKASEHHGSESQNLLAKEGTAGFMRNLRDLVSVSFVHIEMTRAITAFVMSSVILTLVDFGRDNGLEGYDAVALATAYAVGDLGSRIGAGLLTDFKVLSNVSTMAVTFLLQSVALWLMTMHMGYWVLLCCCFLAGLSGGGRIFVCTIMVAEEFDEGQLAFNLGVMNFVSGIALFVRPPIIGYVRESLGAYDQLYLYFAIINAVFTVTWTAKLVWDKRHAARPWRQIVAE